MILCFHMCFSLMTAWPFWHNYQELHWAPISISSIRLFDLNTDALTTNRKVHCQERMMFLYRALDFKSIKASALEPFTLENICSYD